MLSSTAFRKSMPPYSPDKPFHDLLPFSPSTPASASPGSTPKEKPLPPGAVIRYLWTCHQCGCGTFCCDDASVALCVQCEHEICSGCTTSFGSRLLRGVEVEDLPKHAPNPGVSHHARDHLAMGFSTDGEKPQSAPVSGPPRSTVAEPAIPSAGVPALVSVASVTRHTPVQPLSSTAS